jgi:D-aminopeptidase
VALGIGRAGSFAAHGSGEIIVCFSTANRIPRETRKMVYRIKVLLDQRLDPLYEAVVECTEEAILNSMCMAETMEGINGHTVPAIPLQAVRELVQKSTLALMPQPPRPAEKPPAEPPSNLRASVAMPSDVRGAEGMAATPEPEPTKPEPPKK